MRKFLIATLLFHFGCLFAQIRVCSWNVCDMGKSKSRETVNFMADKLKDFDMVALQEIVAGDGGAQAVAKLAEALNRNGAKWNYAVSDATFGTRQKRERYAFLWQPSKVKMIGKPWLDQNFRQEIEREPFFGTFSYGKKAFTLVNFHAITKRLQPETEIRYFKFYPQKYPKLNLVFAGDFNCPQSHSVFNPLRKMGFGPALERVKTTLRKSCKDDCTASEFDNFFFKKSSVTLKSKGAIEFYTAFENLAAAHKISDHLPIWAELDFRGYGKP